MTDFALVFDPVSSTFDWALDGGDLATDDGLETAVFLSWFVDRRADPGDILPDDLVGPLGQGRKGSGNRRGWWGDFMTPGNVGVLPGQSYPVPSDRIGSRIWLYRRRKLTAQLLLDLKGAGAEALQWMIDDKIATAISVTATKYDRQTVTMACTITLARGLPQAFAFPVTVGVAGG